MENEHSISKTNVSEHAPDIRNVINTHSLKERLTNVLEFVLNKLLNNEPLDPVANEEDRLIESVRKASRDWQAAKSNFSMVSDRDLVDQAIYAVAAAEKKYLYLLKLAKKENITADMGNLDLNRRRLKSKEFNT